MESVMHHVRIVLGSALALTLSGLSVACCYVFGTHLAPGQEGQLYGVLGGTADALKAILPLGITAALASGQRMRAFFGVLLFLVFSTYSFASELGLYALSRDAMTSGASADKTKYDTLKKERDIIQARMTALKVSRPTGAIRADIGAQHQSYLWAQSKECTDATQPASRALCITIERLKGELASAEEFEKLRVEDTDLGVRLAGVDLAHVMQSADAQSEALARFTGVEPTTVRDRLALLVALLIELGSGLGFYVATASAHDHQSERTSKPVKVVSVTIEPEPEPVIETPMAAITLMTPSPKGVQALVAEFFETCVRSTPGAEITAGDLYEAYCLWATDHGEAGSLVEFGRHVTKLGHVKEKRGGRFRWQGISLINQLRLVKTA
jgi:hypothetical protein